MQGKSTKLRNISLAGFEDGSNFMFQKLPKNNNAIYTTIPHKKKYGVIEIINTFSKSVLLIKLKHA